MIMFRSIGNLHGKAKKLLQNKLKHIVACSFKIVFATRPGCFDGPSRVTVLLIDGHGKHCLRLDFELAFVLNCYLSYLLFSTRTVIGQFCRAVFFCAAGIF